MNAPEPVIRLERTLKPDFLEEIYEIPGGEGVKACIQCGTCSGSCPASPYMDHTPRQIIAMIRAGMRDEVLSSNTIWMCASCYLCQVRCPAKIKITDIMYALKRLAVKEGKAQPRGELMAQLFISNVEKYGRNSERNLIFSYYLKTAPQKFFSLAPLGMSMLSRGLLPLTNERIEGIEQFRKIIARVNEEGVV